MRNKRKRGTWICFSVVTLILILGPAFKADAPAEHALIKGFTAAVPGKQKNPLLKQQNYIAPGGETFVQRMKTRKA